MWRETLTAGIIPSQRAIQGDIVLMSRSLLRVTLFKQFDRRLNHQQVLLDAFVERTAYPRFDREAWAVLPSGEVDQSQTVDAFLLSRNRRDVRLRCVEMSLTSTAWATWSASTQQQIVATRRITARVEQLLGRTAEDVSSDQVVAALADDSNRVLHRW